MNSKSRIQIRGLEIENPIAKGIFVFQELKGSRILLRPYQLTDAEARFEAMEESREHIRKWDPEDAEQCRTLEETKAGIERANVRRAEGSSFSNGIWTIDGARYLGGLGLHRRQSGGLPVPAYTIGYWIRPTEEGKGYVTEAVGLVVDYALATLKAQRVEIACDPLNVRSVAIPKRLGFKLEGQLRNVYRYPDGRLCDELIFSITPSDRSIPMDTAKE